MQTIAFYIKTKKMNNRLEANNEIQILMYKVQIKQQKQEQISRCREKELYIQTIINQIEADLKNENEKENYQRGRL
ncbi:unnamed protein product [Paramecium octaurelia]|uniref:Uncharacterized protein n=1 Tax=Paramecium octaurelia TaxID=43137 RepID=A0A8S1YCV8_PAROT|nr:unnamed protein product [Paramecium octaurelia]